MNFWDLVKHPVQREVLKKYSQYRYRAESKGFSFNLELQEFNFRIKSPCYICEKPEAGGLDRINNSEGYVWDNIYPCCFDCNRMKSNKSIDDFLEYLTRLNPNHKLLMSFNRLKNADQYNRKVKKLQSLMSEVLNDCQKYERL